MGYLKTIALISGYGLLLGLPAHGQSILSGCDSSLGLAKMEPQPPKGRLQDAGSPQAMNIIRLNKKAIPLLIGCLTDETKTKESIEDYWGETTVGDIAFIFLCDLFTDSSWQHSTIDGVVNWETIEAEYPHTNSAYAWYSYVKKHGRKHVRNIWYKRWKEEEQGIFWDNKEECFKLHPHTIRKAG